MVPDKLFGVLDVKTNRLVKYVLVFFLGQSTGIVLHGGYLESRPINDNSSAYGLVLVYCISLLVEQDENIQLRKHRGWKAFGY